MLAQAGEALTVYPAGRALAMARIDRVDAEGKRFVLDLVGDALPAAGRAVFVASLGGSAKIRFELDTAWTRAPGGPHLVELPLPSSCLVLYRRAEERLDIPLGMDYGARFTLMGRVFDMPLHDFSRGGIGLRATPEQVYELHVGKKVEGVQLDLGPTLRITADLGVRLERAVTRVQRRR